MNTLLQNPVVFIPLLMLGGAGLDRAWALFQQSKLRSLLAEVRTKFDELDEMAKDGFNEAETQRIISYIRGVFSGAES